MRPPRRPAPPREVPRHPAPAHQAPRGSSVTERRQKETAKLLTGGSTACSTIPGKVANSCARGGEGVMAAGRGGKLLFPPTIGDETTWARRARRPGGAAEATHPLSRAACPERRAKTAEGVSRPLQYQPRSTAPPPMPIRPLDDNLTLMSGGVGLEGGRTRRTSAEWRRLRTEIGSSAAQLAPPSTRTLLSRHTWGPESLACESSS